MIYQAPWRVMALNGESSGQVESHDAGLSMVQAALEAAHDMTGMRLQKPTSLQIELSITREHEA